MMRGRTVDTSMYKPRAITAPKPRSATTLSSSSSTTTTISSRKSSGSSSSSASFRNSRPPAPTSSFTSSSASAASTRQKSSRPTAATPSTTTLKKKLELVSDDNQDELRHPECMEIEQFEDTASTTGSSSSLLLSGSGELNIITAVRLRPMSSTEKHKGYRRVVDMASGDGNWVRIVNPVALSPSAQYAPSSSRFASQRAMVAAPAGSASSSDPSFPPQFTQEFHFDHTFWSFDRGADGHKVATQSGIYDELGVFAIENALQGYNCSIFAYGQTSAGKTYTMMGSESEQKGASASASGGSNPAPTRASSVPSTTLKSAAKATAAGFSESSSRRGLIPRICRGLFDKLEERQLKVLPCSASKMASVSIDSSSGFTIHVSYIEVYHERAYDLLAQATTTTKESLKVREHPEDGVYVEHANRVRVTKFDDIKVLIDEGNRVRSVAATNANQRSSRSHAILTLYLTQTGSVDPQDQLWSALTSANYCGASSSAPSTTRSSPSCYKKSKICLVDLAGSERADISGANGTRLREAGSINKSLATLADVISALSKRGTAASVTHNLQQQSGPTSSNPPQQFIPYRNSILTRLLKESLGGNAKTIMLAAISPCCLHYEESLSTLKYIERAKSVVNVARVNVAESSSGSSLDFVEHLRREILELKAKLHISAPSPAPSSVSLSSSAIGKKCALELEWEGMADSEQGPDSSIDITTTQDTPAVPAMLPPAAESPLYAASLCFDEKEKSKLECEVAKLKVQLRKKDREFQLQEYTTKTLNEKVAAQVLKQHAQLINLVGIRKRFLACLKFRALERWRYNSRATSAIVRTPPLPSKATLQMTDKNGMTDTENNNETLDSTEVVKKKSNCKRGKVEEDEEDPACCSTEDDETDAHVDLLPSALATKAKTHALAPPYSQKAESLLSLGTNAPGVLVGGGHLQVDVLCSSIVNDFFGDNSDNNVLAMRKDDDSMRPTLLAKDSSSRETYSLVSKSSKSDNKNNNKSSMTTSNNQLEQLAMSDEYDPWDDDERDDGALVDQIICHEAESNQGHDHEGGKGSKSSDLLLKLALPELRSFDLEEEDEPGMREVDEEDDFVEEEDSSPPAPPRHLSLTSQKQRIQSKLARCLDAIDIARKSMGPTMRKLRQIADKSAGALGDDTGERSLQIGTGMERQLLLFAEKSLLVVNQHLIDIKTEEVSAASSTGQGDVPLYEKLENLVSDFCLQTMGQVCDQLTSAAGGCELTRLPIGKQLDGFQTEIRELLALLLSSGSHLSRSSSRTRVVLSLMEMVGLSERIRFAWYAIDQKNRQRLVQCKSHQQLLATTEGTMQQMHTQATELQLQCDALVKRLESQTAEFAKREEEDRLTLLLRTHKLEEEHEQRVAALEKELLSARLHVGDLEEQLLEQTSKIELLEQELELTAVVSSTNELLHRHGSEGSTFGGADGSSDGSTTPSGSQCANIIVKLEEELATALIQINELETTNVASIRDAAESGGDPSASLVDLEMLEYMERTSEIEKQNSEAISKLTAAMEHDFGAASGASDHHDDLDAKLATAEAHGRELEARNELMLTTVSKIKEELMAALTRAEMLEVQHMKLMVSYENQADTAQHLEDQLYESEAAARQAEEIAVDLRERVKALEEEVGAAARLNGKLHDDADALQKELRDAQDKSAALETACSELTTVRESAAVLIAKLQGELNAMARHTWNDAAESRVTAAEERCAVLASMHESLTTDYVGVKTSLADLQMDFDETVAHASEREEQYRDSMEVHANQATYLVSLEGALRVVQERNAELEVQLDLQTKTAKLQTALEERTALSLQHQEEMSAVRSAMRSLQMELDAAQNSVKESEAKTVALDAECATRCLAVSKLEEDLHRALLRAKQLDGTHAALVETHDSQTLVLSEVEDSLASAEARVRLLENESQCAKRSHVEEVETLKGEIADSEAEFTVLKHAMAASLEDQCARTAELEHRLHDTTAELAQTHVECTRLADAYELQASLAREEWEQKVLAQTQQMQTLQHALDEKVSALNDEISNREGLAQDLQVQLDSVQSSHASEIRGWETRFRNTVAELNRDIEKLSRVANEWECKYQELQDCVSPDAIRKVREQIASAKAHADECEATYRVELENKLQLEFDLASVQKELHTTKQQLVELQYELEAGDSSASSSATAKSALAKHPCDGETESGPSTRTELEAQINALAQQLREANCRSEMQVEELHSYRSWVALQELLNSAARGKIDSDKLSPEARRLVLKHLNSLDTWFERAILGKSGNDGRYERRASLLAVMENSELEFLKNAATLDGDRHEDDNHFDVSDADAVPVELDDLGDELLAMCGVGPAPDKRSLHKERPARPNYDDLDAIFAENPPVSTTRIAATHHVENESIGTTEHTILSKSGVGCGSAGGGNSKDVLTDVAQLKLTILKLKEVLDAKEETILFLDDKMKYYEELLGNSDQKSA